LIWLPFLAAAQSDTAATVPPTDITDAKPALTPWQIAQRSLYLPGYGQWTNQQYWKTPIMAGAVGTGLYGTVHYSRQSSIYREALIKRLDTASFPVDRFYGQLSNQELFEATFEKAAYQRYSLFFLIYAHGVNVLDAYSAARMDDNDGRHSPTRAAYLSALLPGLGQVYNRKYWKLPLVYGLLGGTIYATIFNSTIYKNFMLAHVNRVDEDPASMRETELTVQYATSELRAKADQFKKYRDMSYLATAGAYLLIMVDAIVDAHLYDFDISDDLSASPRHWSQRLTLEPVASGWNPTGGYTGLSLTFRF
jgi:hypothetical protein